MTSTEQQSQQAAGKAAKNRNRSAPFFLRTQFMMAVLMLIFGFILISHIKSVRSDVTKENLAMQYKQRQAQLQKAEEQYQALLAENDRLNQQKSAAIADLLNRRGYDQLLAELEHIRVLAGFTEVRGPGVVLALNDKPGYDILTDSLQSIVHDGDIRHALDLFKAAGAAGFSVNGLRITNSSYVSCIGSTILCNQQRMTPPYMITALGDPAKLAEAIRSDPEFTERQGAAIGLRIQVEEMPEVVLPPFAEADDFYRFIDLLEVPGP
jgi:uncharacterized protein YlxW (UPF0749 family)